MSARIVTAAQAIREATDLALAADPSVYVMGLGATDPLGIFGTTKGLLEKYGPKRIFDMPVAENGMTGVGVGAAITGMRPIMVHQRIDFTLLALDQIVNSAAKWHYMYDGKASVPIVIRMIVGRGWGQGPQHSQSLHATYGHIPGLKVVMPVTAADSKGLLLAAIADDDPVIFIEHRWLHNVRGEVSEDAYTVPLGRARVAREGTDVSLIASSYNVLECLKAAELLALDGIAAEVVDLRTIAPLDVSTILASAAKTRRVVAVDGGWKTFGVAAEILALVGEHLFSDLLHRPLRLTAPDVYVPSTPALANHYYPSTTTVVNAVRGMFALEPKTPEELGFDPAVSLDQPHSAFVGPF